MLDLGAYLVRDGEIFTYPSATTTEWPALFPISWSVDNSSVASIDELGVLRGVSPGLTILTLRAGPLTDTTAVRVVAASEAASVFSSVAIGRIHACAIGPENAVFCWGNNSDGQTGYGSARRFTLTLSPVRAVHSAIASQISVNGSSACAVSNAGIASCWGENRSGELGDGSKTSRAVPVEVSGGHLFRSIGVGVEHVCGLTTAGAAYCWGDNTQRQLGRPGAESAIPVMVDTDLLFDSVAVGSDFSCGLTSTGQVYCWGSNFGQVLGAPATVSGSTSPVLVNSPVAFVGITAGRAHACGLTAARSAYCWGLNASGQLGIDNAQQSVPTPTPVFGDRTWRNISAGFAHTCAVADDSTGWCWGSNVFGALGNPAFDDFQLRPIPVDFATAFSRVVAAKGDDATCGIDAEGVAYCWGSNTNAKLGIGTYSDTSGRIVRAPRRVARPL